jgi:hypothetical protein
MILKKPQLKLCPLAFTITKNRMRWLRIFKGLSSQAGEWEELAENLVASSFNFKLSTDITCRNIFLVELFLEI